MSIFSTVFCQALSRPSNGKLIEYSIDPLSGGYTVDTVATMDCNSGYRRQGFGSRTCQPSGSWSGQTPTCNRSKENEILCKLFLFNQTSGFSLFQLYK